MTSKELLMEELSPSDFDLEWLKDAASRVLTTSQSKIFFLFLGSDANGTGKTREEIALRLGLSMNGVWASLKASKRRLALQWIVRNSLLDCRHPPDTPNAKNNSATRKSILVELFGRLPKPISFDRFMCRHESTANHSEKCAIVPESAFKDLERSGYIQRNRFGWLLTKKGMRMPQQLRNRIRRQHGLGPVNKTVLLRLLKRKSESQPEPQPDLSVWVGNECQRCGYEVPTKHMGVCKTGQARDNWIRAFKLTHERKHSRILEEVKPQSNPKCRPPETARRLTERNLFEEWAHLNDVAFPSRSRFDVLRERLPKCGTRMEAQVLISGEGCGGRYIRLPEWLP